MKRTEYSIGLDPSLTSFGVALNPIGPVDDEIYHFALQSTAKDGSDQTRINTMVDLLYEALGDLDGDIQIAVFEDYGPINKTSGKITARAEICGVLKRYFLTERRIPIVAVAPKSLKSFATGNGNADKKQIINACARFGVYPDTSDEADAYFLSRLGKSILTGTRIGIPYQRYNP